MFFASNAVAAAEAAAAAEAHARAAWMAAQLEEQRRAVAAREAEAQGRAPRSPLSSDGL